VDEDSDTWNLVRSSQAGVCVPPGKQEELARAILSLRVDLEACNKMGRNGRTWAEAYHSPGSAADEFEKMFFRVINQPEE
jgi:glycosyltransferase involved in cell wall biosynthesis